MLILENFKQTLENISIHMHPLPVLCTEAQTTTRRKTDTKVRLPDEEHFLGNPDRA
jgi:hypothetical protein